MNREKIISLISLLDDEKEATASFAIKEILAEGSDALKVLSEFQESSNPLLRKRVHQIQAISLIRKNRDILSRRFANKHSGLWNGLMEIHLTWFDRDTKDNINALFLELLQEFSEKEEENETEKISSFMKINGFVKSIAGEADSDYFCLGTVLESRIGSDAILCSIAYKLLVESGINADLVKYRDLICLLMPSGEVVIPDTWEVERPEKTQYKIAEPGQILKYTMMQLMFSTICSENYRYAYSIGKCLKKNEQKR